MQLLESDILNKENKKPKCHFGLQKVRVHDLVRGEESQEEEEEKEEEGRGEVQKSGMPLS